MKKLIRQMISVRSVARVGDPMWLVHFHFNDWVRVADYLGKRRLWLNPEEYQLLRDAEWMIADDFM